MSDNSELQIFTKDLLPETFVDGIFLEVEGSNNIKALFDVTYDSDDMGNGKFRLKPSVSIEELKSLPESFRRAVFMPSNKSVSWEDADSYESLRTGAVFRHRSVKNLWICDKPIGITLKKGNVSNVRYNNRFDEELYNRELHKSKCNPIDPNVNSSNKVDNLLTDKNEDNTHNKIFHNDIYSDEVKEAEASHLQEFNESIIIAKEDDVSLSGLSTDENIIQGPDKQVGEIKECADKINNSVSNLHIDSIQYLMSGRDGENFFFEGSDTDKAGASFKMEYDSHSLKGEYSLIVDFNNLKTINSGFRRGVIKMINNGTTIREATGFTMVEKGQAHFSKQDHVWMVEKPLVIKLIK